MVEKDPKDGPGDRPGPLPSEIDDRVLRHAGWHLAFDCFVVVCFFVVNLVLIWLVHGAFNSAFGLTILIGIDGLVIGALLSFAVTSYSRSEAGQWSRLRAALAGVVAGISVSVLSEPVAYIFKDARIFNDPVLATRVAVFVAWLGFGLIYGVSYRRYYIHFDAAAGMAASRVEE